MPDINLLNSPVTGHILVVDDDFRNRKLLKDLLTLHGHTVAEAENGLLGLQSIERHPPDVVMLDVMMPVLSGFEVCRRIKSQPATAHIAVLLVTALSERIDRIEGIEAGADDFITKPIDREEITLRVRNAIVTKRLREQVAHEKAVRASEARFRALIENSKEMIFLLTPDGVIQYASPSVEYIMRYKAEDLLSRSVFDLIHPEDLPALVNEWQRVIQHPEFLPDTLLTRVRHADGSWHIHEGVGTNLLNDPNVNAFVLNSRDVTERRQREQELESIAVVSAALRTAPTRAEMLPVILDQVMAIFKSNGIALAMHDPLTGETFFEMARGEFARGLWDRLPPGKGISGYVIETGQVYLNNQLQTDPLFIRRDLLDHIQALACIPLIAQSNNLGAIMVGRDDEILPAELRLLTSIADISANAIHRASLYEQTERRLKHLTALRQVDLAIGSSLDLQVTFNVLLVQALEQLQADAIDILLFNPHLQTLEYAFGQGFRSRAVQNSRQRIGEGYAGRAILQRSFVSVKNLPEVGRKFLQAELITVEGFITYHAIPLTAKGQAKGVLEVFHRSAFTPDSEWRNFLETLAGQAAIAIDNAELFQDLQRSNIELVLAYDATIEGWSRALDLRDKETEGHTKRVTEMTETLARTMGIGSIELVHIRRGSLLHDIGKMGVPDSILLKPGALTHEEMEIMRRHSRYAYDMLTAIAYLRPALDIPYCHHEKWDGSGYPRGLKGEQIPMAARIFAVVDVWDAMTSERPYHPALPKAQALEYIRKESGKHFDPRVVDIFLRRLNQA
jgi:PAS domain S-box-containing protein